MIELSLHRTHQTRQQTLGELSAWKNGQKLFSCFTLELPWRDNENRVSCIPPRRYAVEPRTSLQFDRHLWVRGVEGRSWILIHPGNFVSDTAGCILVGAEFTDLNSDGLTDVADSRRTLNRLLRVVGEESANLTVYAPESGRLANVPDAIEGLEKVEPAPPQIDTSVKVNIPDTAPTQALSKKAQAKLQRLRKRFRQPVERKVKSAGVWGLIGSMAMAAVEALSPGVFAFLGPWAVPAAALGINAVQFAAGYLTESDPQGFQADAHGAEDTSSFAPSQPSHQPGANAPSSLMANQQTPPEGNTWGDIAADVADTQLATTEQIVSSEALQERITAKLDAQIDVPLINDALEETAFNTAYDLVQNVAVEAVQDLRASL